jgi:hypothetical protein
MDDLPPIGTTSCASPDPRRVRRSDRMTSTQDEKFANARHQLEALLKEEATLKAAEHPPQPSIPPPVPNPPPVPPQPQPQPQPQLQQPTVNEFEDVQANKENQPGNEEDGDGKKDAEPVCHIINIAGNQMCIRDARIPPRQFQGTKTWDKTQRVALTNEDQL